MAPHNPYLNARTSFRPSWKRYSYRPNRRLGQPRQQSVKAPILKFAVAAIFVMGLFLLVFFLPKSERRILSLKKSQTPVEKPIRLTKDDVRVVLSGHSLTNLTDNRLFFDYEGYMYGFETSIDNDLQGFLISKLNRVNARAIGLVALDPASGRILAMVSHAKDKPGLNTCVTSQFPAASIFKIVTAAAAIDTKGLSAQAPMLYNGGKHTLYRSQLKKTLNKYTRHINLKKAFADSINPVFGKLGVHLLKDALLGQYAQAFRFNRTIGLEIKMTKSRIDIPEKSYGWAEIASGFNNDTTISPLHGALMAAAVINQGQMAEPTIIDKITNENQDILYQNGVILAGRAFLPSTADVLKELMAETIKTGTARNAFRGYKKDAILSKLNLGGKTGSIDNDNHEIRYDWFVGFGQNPNSGFQIAVAALVAHEKFIGTRAGTYARLAIKQFFRKHAGLESAKKNK
jgi:penicillin-binding protein A